MDSPTHDAGGTLDVMFSRSDLAPVYVQVSDPGISDHCLVTWCVKASKPAPVYHSILYRPWKCLDNSDFRSALFASPLCNHESWQDLDPDNLADLFDSSMSSILEILLPERSLKIRRRVSDLWFDSECRSAKRNVRRQERNLRRLKRQCQDLPDIIVPAQRLWKRMILDYRQLLRGKRECFWFD